MTYYGLGPLTYGGSARASKCVLDSEGTVFFAIFRYRSSVSLSIRGLNMFRGLRPGMRPVVRVYGSVGECLSE